ncbi:MAG: sugar nucleotide-binding protein [Anaerolineales bacterium]|nr:sugar nucleotide-binding protein [Anaerolineales bacterium]
MRMLITGGSGYLGRDLVRQATAAHNVAYSWFRHDPLALPHGQQLDLREETAVLDLATRFRPDVIIHTAGSNRGDDLHGAIVDGTRHVVAAAAAVQARLIHLSTDSIFDGLAGTPYDESTPPSPVNAYGRAKAAAEDLVRPYPNHVIVRTSLIYDLREMDHGTQWMAEALRAGRPVTLFTNQRRSPVWRQTLSLACLELAALPFTGTLNVAGSQVLTRAEFSLRMLDWWGISSRETLSFGPSPAGAWPLDCALDVRRATAVLSTPLPGVDAVLSPAKRPQTRS